MIIAINANQQFHSLNIDHYLRHLIDVATEHREHQFIFITPEGIEEPENISDNILSVISAPLANNRLLSKIWFDYTLPGIVKKHKATLLIHTGLACSMRTTINQWIFVSDLSFLQFPHHFSKASLVSYKTSCPVF